jgi:hypothetical protein
MASTFTIDSTDGRYVQGNRHVRKGSGNLGTYATNGVAVTVAQLEFPGTIAELDIGPSAGIIYEWDKTNSKVKAYRQKDPGAAGGADIALPEVANGVDLSSLAFRFRAEGY